MTPSFPKKPSNQHLDETMWGTDFKLSHSRIQFKKCAVSGFENTGSIKTESLNDREIYRLQENLASCKRVLMLFEILTVLLSILFLKQQNKTRRVKGN